MTTDHVRLIYMALIAGYAGKATWYNLCRSLDGMRIVNDDFMEVIGELAKAGFITLTKGDMPGDEQYTITAQGEARLQAHKRERLRRIERRILELIGASPGKLGWYNLRYLTVKGDADVDFQELTALLDALVAEGCLTVETAPGVEASAYRLTAKGQARLES